MANLQILGASWGLITVTTTVIDKVQRQNVPQTLSIAASNSVFGDGWKNVGKTLCIAYRYGETGSVQVATAKEGGSINITGPPAEGYGEVTSDDSQPQLTVYAAAYGPKDCTSTVQAMIKSTDQSLTFTANDQTFSDSWAGTKKSFTIVAAFTGQVPFTDVLAEGSSYFLKYRPAFAVLSAAWGIQDATAIVQSLAFRRTLSIDASNQALGFDGWPTNQKTLVVVYQYGNEQPQSVITTEGNHLSIDYSSNPAYQPPLDSSSLNVIAAAWGPASVTTPVISKVGGGSRLDLVANIATFGDSWPHKKKSFVLSYSWGPSAPQTLVLPEGGIVTVDKPRPDVSSGLVALTGMISEGDNIAVQTGIGLYLTVASSGQILGNGTSLGANSTFQINTVQGALDQISLSCGSAPVGVGSDGTLYANSSLTPAKFVLSLTTSGSLVISVVGSTSVFASVRATDTAIIAAGTDDLTFDTTFSLSLNCTAAGFQNHVDRHGIDLTIPEDGDTLALIKLVWDLTGGFFIALGLGPLLNGSTTIQTGVYSLITQNATVNRALTAVIAAVKNNIAATATAGLFVSFIGSIYDAGLLWKILRFCLVQVGWKALAWILTKILACISPIGQAAQAAEIIIAFASWAYTTTKDAIAYINSVGAASVSALQALASGNGIDTKLLARGGNNLKQFASSTTSAIEVDSKLKTKSKLFHLAFANQSRYTC